MSEPVIEALKRTEKPKQVRRNGFIPGVIYGKGMDSISVKFDEQKLHKALQGHSSKAKISVQLENEMKHCFIQEIQRDTVKGKTLHIALHEVKDDEIVKVKVPIFYSGLEELDVKRLILQPYLTEIELSGRSADIPEYIPIDVAHMPLGTKITVGDLQINPTLKILEEPEKMVAVVTAVKHIPSEEAEEKPTEEQE